MTSEKAAWLAGFFDGEGCLSAAFRPGVGAYARVQIAQKDRAVLDEIKDLLGFGSIAVYSSGVHSYRISDPAHIRTFIELILPYAVVKRDKLRVAHALACLYQTRERGRNGSWVKLDPVLVARRVELAEELRVRRV